MPFLKLSYISSVVEKRITFVKHNVADTSVFIAAVSAKEEEVRRAR